MPNKYSENLFKNKEVANDTVLEKFGNYILNYVKILDAQKNNNLNNENKVLEKSEDTLDEIEVNKEKSEFENVETDVLNYILEIFLPIAEIFLEINEKDGFIFNEYEKLQNEFFNLLKLKNLLEAEGKFVKYENIMSESIKLAIDTKNKKMLTGVQEFLVSEKKKEFLKNLKKPEIFQEILEKYGEIKKYETYVKFFIALDNFGEEEFLNNLEKDLKEFYLQDDNVVEYKTEKVMKIENSGIFEDDYEIGFIDFFCNKFVW